MENVFIFPCLSRRRSDAVLDNEKVFLIDNGKCIYFCLSVPQKKFGLTQPLSANSVRVLLAINNIVRGQEKRKMPGTNPLSGNFIFSASGIVLFLGTMLACKGLERFRGQGKFWLGKKFKDRFFICKKYHCPVDNTKLPLGKVPSFLLANACASMIFHWLEIPLSCGQYKVAIGQSIFTPVGKRCSAWVQNALSGNFFLLFLF